MTATATPPQTLPETADAAERDQLSMFGRVGQLALPGAAAQLGLDGVAYAVDTAPTCEAVPSARSPERASQSLGTNSTFCIPAESLGNAPSDSYAPAQIALDLKAWEAAPQLTMWGRLRVQRDVLKYSEWDRYAKCGMVRFLPDADVGANRRDTGSWSPTNVIRCRYPGCPWCGGSLAQQRANELGACIAKFFGEQGDEDRDVWMLTPTIPHYATDSASLVVDQLYAAQAMFVRSKEWREFRAQWGILTNGARHFDAVIGGANGLHAHFHTALFATRAGLPTSEAWRLGLDDNAKASEWLIPQNGIERFWAASIAEDVSALPLDLATQLRAFGIWRKLKTCSQSVREKYLDDVRAPLVVAWERCCEAVGVVITNREQFRRTALKLTPGEDAAAYYTGWMLADEVTRSVSKNQNPVRLLDAIEAGVKGAAFTYKQFRRAVDGRQWVSGLTDLRTKLGVNDEDVEAYADERRRRREKDLEREGNPVQRKRELNLVVRRHLFPAVSSSRYEAPDAEGKPRKLIGWDAVFAFIDDREVQLTADTLPPVEVLQRELDDFLFRNLALARDSRLPNDDEYERFVS